jgi:hypothetical protein
VNLIKTKSFTLAVRTEGDKNASKVVIMLPGRLDTKDYANFVSHLEYLAGKGFYAVAMDPPGTWESPGPIDLFTTTNYIKAVNELIEYFGNRPTLLLGHSRGGNIAILASTNPHVVGIVLVISSYGAPYPPKSPVNGVQMEYRDLPPGRERTKEQVEFAMSLKYFEEGKNFDTLAVIKNCKKPKLMFSATNDKYYTPREIEEIYDSVPEPKMLFELNSDHGYRRHAEVIKEVNRVMGKFIDKYLK